MQSLRLSLALISLLAAFSISSVALAEVPAEFDGESAIEVEAEPQDWWEPSYLIDYGVILTGTAGYLIGENLTPRGQALIGPQYDPDDPLPIFTDPVVGRTYLDEGTEESVPTRWVEVGVASSMIFVAALEGANWAVGAGSGLEFHHAVMGSLETTALTGAITSLSKPFFGRLRPDFGERGLRYHCPAEAERFGEVCEGYADRPLDEDPDQADKLMRDGQKSFISGHSSHGYNLFTYAALVLGGRYVWGRDATTTSRAVVIPVQLAMVSAGSYFAFSRLVDGRHYTSDVLVGSAVGLGLANLSYWRRFHLDGTPRVRNPSAANFDLTVAPGPDGAMLQFSMSY